MKPVRIAHSPDSDDHFLFWALRHRLVDWGEYSFTFETFDTEDLNQSAIDELFDVTAVSLAVYPKISGNYFILPHGASVGRNYGPVILSCNNLSRAELNSARIGIPGQNTTAALLLRRIAPEAITTPVPLTPYGLIFERLQAGDFDAAVVIHEGQLSYSRETFSLVLDLGAYWRQETNLPLPVGINVIHQRLEETHGRDSIREISMILRKSIHYGLLNKEKILPDLFQQVQAAGAKLANIEELNRYLSLYANEDSADLADDCRQAIAHLLGDEIRYAP